MSTTTFEKGLAEVRDRLERIEGELHDLDTSLERLQADAAETAWKAREAAEAAIGAARDRRIALGESVARLRDAATGASNPSIPTNGKEEK